MESISRGVLGDGIAAVVSGLLGTYGLTISTANVGLVAATGVASRVIAFAVAALLVLVALQPALIGILTIMPRPVMAAALLFTAVFIMIDWDVARWHAFVLSDSLYMSAVVLTVWTCGPAARRCGWISRNGSPAPWRCARCWCGWRARRGPKADKG